MKTHKLKLVLAILLAVIYNLFFWEETLGINLFIFSLLLTCVLLYFNPYAWFHRNFKMTLLGTIISGIGMVLFNSATSKIVHLSSIVIMVGFIHQAFLKTIYYAFLQYFLDLFKVPTLALQGVKGFLGRNTRFNKTFGYLRLSLIPLLILTVFYWIYKVANPVFDQLSSNFWDQLSESLSFFFRTFSFNRLLFIVAGSWVIAGAVFYKDLQSILNLQIGKRDDLTRERVRKPKVDYSLYITPIKARGLSVKLKSFLQSGMILLVMVNLLLLIVNLIDISWVWFNFNPMTVQDLRQFVHTGTYMLILSILLSMIILLYYFKGNLNFYSKNNSIKFLSYAWIVQNLILAISVGLRNYHYINSYGFAYKRIGVIIFLALTVVGLITLFFKIRNTRTAFYLYRINSWALYTILIIMSLVNWDGFIANFNIKNYKPEVVDTQFLLTLSDKSLDVLVEHEELFENRGELGFYIRGTYKSHSEYLDFRVKRFIKEYEQRSWLSWNLAESNAYNNLKLIYTPKPQLK